MKKLIQMNHKVCDYECMWNGIEDLYHSYNYYGNSKYRGKGLSQYVTRCK